jgi:hypothetical protein
MVDEYVRRSTFRAGVVSSQPGRLLRSSAVARDRAATPYHVGELSNGNVVACTRTTGSSLLQAFDGLLQLQRTLTAPVSSAALVTDMVVNIVFVAQGVAHLMHIDGALLARFNNKDKDCYARSVTQFADGAFALLSGSSEKVRVYSAGLRLQRSFMHRNDNVSGEAYRVGVTGDDDSVVARDGGVQWYRRDGTLLRELRWPTAPTGQLSIFGMAVDAESRIVVSAWDRPSVLVLRHDGTLMRSFRAERFSPRGVAITAEGHIVVCNGYDCSECLQLWA